MATATATAPALVWFRRDLRLADNPALHAAVQSGRPLLFVYIREEDTALRLSPGAAADWWLHHSLTALAADIERLGGRLSLRQGAAANSSLEQGRPRPGPLKVPRQSVQHLGSGGRRPGCR